MAFKLGAAAVVALAAFLVFRGGGPSAGKVAKCLEDKGATVSETRFLEDTYFGGQDLPPEIASRLRKVEKGNYDVELGSDSGLLMVVKGGHTADDVNRALGPFGGTGIAQGSGRVVMYWYQVPSDESAAALDRCL